mgnify:CR=1 FL=1
MSTPTWIKDILRGGLPEVLDLGDQMPRGDESQNADGTRPEQNAPSNLAGYESGNPPGNFLYSLGNGQIVNLAVLALGALAVVYVFKKV